jgi:hypothetical protein
MGIVLEKVNYERAYVLYRTENSIVSYGVRATQGITFITTISPTGVGFRMYRRSPRLIDNQTCENYTRSKMRSSATRSPNAIVTASFPSSVNDDCSRIEI